MSREALNRIKEELNRFPPLVGVEYTRAVENMQSQMMDDEVSLWAEEGLRIASETVRSWEAAVEYFRASAEVAKYVPFPSLVQWARCGVHLAQDSPALAVSFFKASPGVLPNIRPQYVPRWASLGRQLYKGTWKSSTLAAKFFDVAPALMRALPFWDVEVLAMLIDSLSQKSHDTAMECLSLAPNTLGRLGREREAFLTLLRNMSDGGWRQIKSCMEVAPSSLPLLEETQRPRFLRLAERLSQAGHREMSHFIHSGCQAISHTGLSNHRHILDLCDALLEVSSESVPAFLSSLDQALVRVGMQQLDLWFQAGFTLLRENSETGLAYFSLESATSETVLETLSSTVELDRVREVVRMYCRALAGTHVEIQSSQELAKKGIGWVEENQASTEGTKVFLPPIINRYGGKAHNFAWLKAVATHQVAHLEFGSFRFSFDKSALLFKDWRHHWEKERQSLGKGTKGSGSSTNGSEPLMVDMTRFFGLFLDRPLALDIFTVLEDGRLDCIVKHEYRGIATHYRWVQKEALDNRPPVEQMPVRTGMVEFMLRLSLGKNTGIKVPTKYFKEARALARIAKHLFQPVANVEDTAEATVRAYQIISRLPNEKLAAEDFQPQDFDQEEQYSEEEMKQQFGQSPQDSEARESDEGDEQQEEPYESPAQVEFRGEFKPELVQLLNMLRSQRAGDQKQEIEISKEMLEELLKQSAELQLDQDSGQSSTAVSDFAEKIMKEAGMPPPQAQQGQGQGPFVHEEEQGGPLEAREPRTYVYDEWDFRALDYKPRWCIVREKVVEQGEVQFFDEALRSYASLMTEIRRQFELVIPESFRKVRRFEDGEDLDLDAVIEATTDQRAGVPPSDKVFWRRNKIERNVAVVFLLDMSASTAEAIDDGRYDEQQPPDDPVEYMIWLRSRREGHGRRHYKRIIDLEKESVALLMQSLETIGDTYGIYGFSGYGRENVEFYVIKDVVEGFSDKVKRRLDKITPLHATRMGPAIRHATTKLEKQDAKTKILFLISDGRPQDRGYSREGVEKEYAVHDTHMALTEAKHKNIMPFCLTVDKTGHDYLKTMCGDMGYEVLADIWALPRRLPMLYRRLTI